MRSKLLAATVACALAACGGGDDAGTKAPASGWIEVPGMICADGSQTGIGILPGSSDAVLVYLSLGGACWSETECDVLTRGPFGARDFLAVRGWVTGTIFDRMLEGNPFASWTHVFVPYCTGDVHVGDSVQTYGIRGTWEHRGYRNLQAAVERMVALLPRPSTVVVAGSSAGGFGALVAYDLVRQRWTADGADPVTASLLDDSGPTFVGAALPAALHQTWRTRWNLASTIETICPGCDEDLSEIWPALRDRYPGDRLALVSTTQDLTMRTFLGLDPASFEAALSELSQTIDPLPGVEIFRVGGPDAGDHALLLAPALYSASDGTPLLEWLTDLTDLQADWTSRGP
jgi:hypothetical protein